MKRKTNLKWTTIHRDERCSCKGEKIILLYIDIILVISSFKVTCQGSDEYCDTEVFRAECADSEVIIMDRARYGRMKIGRCVETDMGYLGCSADVLHLADRRCSGRRMCELRVPDGEFEMTSPCLKELKTYLEATYSCVKVETTTAEQCRVSDRLEVTSYPEGYIASVMTSETYGCNDGRHAWVISGDIGQRVNLTLVDFTMSTDMTTTYKMLNSPFFESCEDFLLTDFASTPGHPLAINNIDALSIVNIVGQLPWDIHRIMFTDQWDGQKPVYTSGITNTITLNIGHVDDDYGEDAGKKYNYDDDYIEEDYPLVQVTPSNPSNNQASPGAVRISLQSVRGPHPPSLKLCSIEYGVIEDSGRPEELTKFCDQKQRVSSLYESRGNVVHLWMTSRGDAGGHGGSGRSAAGGGYLQPRFLVRYTVIGCPDPIIPARTWFTRLSDAHGTMGCIDTDITWPVTCQEDGVWKNAASVNCSLRQTTRSHARSQQTTGGLSTATTPSEYLDGYGKRTDVRERSLQDVPHDTHVLEYAEWLVIAVTAVIITFIVGLLFAIIFIKRRQRKFDAVGNGTPRCPETALLAGQGIDNNVLCGQMRTSAAVEPCSTPYHEVSDVPNQPKTAANSDTGAPVRMTRITYKPLPHDSDTDATPRITRNTYQAVPRHSMPNPSNCDKGMIGRDPVTLGTLVRTENHYSFRNDVTTSSYYIARETTLPPNEKYGNNIEPTTNKL